MPLTEISHVISKLDYIIHWSKIHKSKLGYFAGLYQRTTIEVEKAIDAGYFDHPEFMTRLDVRFAEYYLRAFESYMRRDPYISASWLYAFNLANTDQISVLQHLLLGMNAHINLDLGITVAEMTTPSTIKDYKLDFYRINKILYSLVDQMQDMIAEIWGIFKIADFMLGRLDEKLIELTLRFFRNQAWAFANDLVTTKSDKQKWIKIEKMDQKVKGYAQRIGFPIATKFNPLYHAIILKEERNIDKIINILHHADIYSKW